uniref:Ovule protein n=1 Tax=Strongyloides venezuelensis TaxID=75913 RepID=A0A0K0G5C0_STRVS
MNLIMCYCSTRTKISGLCNDNFVDLFIPFPQKRQHLLCFRRGMLYQDNCRHFLLENYHHLLRKLHLWNNNPQVQLLVRATT